MSSQHTISLSGVPEAYLQTRVRKGEGKSKVVQDALTFQAEWESREADRLGRLEAKLDEALGILKMLQGRVL